MGDVPSTPAAALPPRTADAVAPAERIASLDVLRGLALLGILVMNIQLFAMVGIAYKNPTAPGPLEGPNYWVWYAGAVLADNKFLAIFSMLFGAGVLLMAGRQEAAGRRAALLHYRRMAVLLVFGLLHAHLLWAGDILYSYALCGMAVYPLRRLRPGPLFALGLVVLGVGSALSLVAFHDMASWPPEAVAEFRQDFQPTPERIAREVAAYRSGWLGAFHERQALAWALETTIFVTYLAWRAGGLMLLGMALFKLGAFHAAWPRGAYVTMILLGVLVGVPIIDHGIRLQVASGWDPGYVLFVGSQYNYWASLLVALGWVGGVMLACRSPALRPATRPLAAVGRTALTNYLLQSVLCTTVFYGYGLGWFGQLDRVGQLGVVVAVWALQLVASPLWLRYFRIGPAEWLWRTLTYLRVQPLLAGAKPL